MKRLFMILLLLCNVSLWADDDDTRASIPESLKNDPNIIFFQRVPALDINIEKEYMNHPDVKRLFQLLGISKPYSVIYLVDNQPLGHLNREDNIVSVETRSFVSMLDYLSNGVEVPLCVLEQGIVAAPRYPDGQFFDTTEMTKGIFKVRICKERPRENVNVEVFYRNHWFYIEDTDVSSKRTMAFVQQVFNVLSGNKQTQMSNPILTIPVSPAHA